ncbi:uncharacterized protein TRIADDRAFT_57088 [Trichoplax adhaerens]|uniref:Uncharacterized protein n=1 Tax=Trichoplax adhaerens TaxID=10228 RepID=B3S0L0_TRIAD|nr:predicted protein [Trichoplax adhaerens]EDV24029.1 predicted protein [Trichoplax adhaerens]|eukprot:XP_002113555.1 predicted protein [Trichoplax adhaerens]
MVFKTAMEISFLQRLPKYKIKTVMTIVTGFQFVPLTGSSMKVYTFYQINALSKEVISILTDGIFSYCLCDFSRNLTMQCVVLSEVLLALDVYLSNVRAVSGLTVPPRHFDPNHSVFKPIAHVITADLPTYSFNPFYLL